MEDFLAAYQARASDTEALMGTERWGGAVHFGGCTVECLLKSLIVLRFGIDSWDENTDGEKHGISNPSHDLQKAFQTVPELVRRLKQSRHLQDALNILQNPKLDFIDMRYDGEPLPEERYKEWQKAYRVMLSWLHTQSTKLPKPKRGR